MLSLKNNILKVRDPITKEFKDFPTIGITKEYFDQWMEEHPEERANVDDGSLTEKKFSDELKKYTIKDYVTPEMFGAIGNGIVDDTEAIQRAIDTEKKVILTQRYAITGLTVTGKSYNLLGKIIEGGGELILTSNEDGILLTGSGHSIKGIKMSLSEELQNNGYDYAFIHIKSTEALVSQNHNIDVIIQPYTLNNEDISHNSKGIQITAEGETGYSYDNTITAHIRGLRYGVYCERGEKSWGINANTYNLDIWNCDCGFYGYIGGSIINGTCQSRRINFTYNFFENFKGENNVINAFIYDLRHADNGEDGSERQYLIDDNLSGINNIFTANYNPLCIKNYRAKNRYNFMNNYLVPSAGFNTVFPLSTNQMTVAPYSNCFKSVEVANVEQNNVKAFVVSATNYPTYNVSERTLADCAYLCKDNYLNRYIGFQRINSEDIANATISITIPEDTIVQYIFVEKLNIGTISCSLDDIELSIITDNEDCIIFFNSGGKKTTKNTTAVLTFNFENDNTGYIKRISAVGYSWANGTI